MKAARWYKAKDIRVEKTNIPSPNENQVKIEVKFTGICGSDLHEYTNGPQLIPMKWQVLDFGPVARHCLNQLFMLIYTQNLQAIIRQK